MNLNDTNMATMTVIQLDDWKVLDAMRQMLSARQKGKSQPHIPSFSTWSSLSTAAPVDHHSAWAMSEKKNSAWDVDPSTVKKGPGRRLRRLRRLWCKPLTLCHPFKALDALNSPRWSRVEFLGSLVHAVYTELSVDQCSANTGCFPHRVSKTMGFCNETNHLTSRVPSLKI